MLKGIRVIDFSRYFPGPFGTERLRALGAEVIKVEDPGIGDLCRGSDRIDGQEGAMFRSLNWGKKSVALDLKNEDDHKKVLKLIQSADAVVESFRPGVAKRLRIDYETVSALNPKLVYVSISGYGQNSYLSKLGGHDPNYLAMAGLLSQLCDKNGVPIRTHATLGDFTTGLITSECVLAGLFKAQREGKGQYFDLSMTEATMSLLSTHITWASLKEGNMDLCECICNGIYETSDGRYMTIAAAEPKFFYNFCSAVGRPDLFEHQFEPDIEDNPYKQEMVEIFLSRTFEEWTRFGEEVDCCMAPVLNPEELATARHVVERRMIEKHNGMDILRPYYSLHLPSEGIEAPFPVLGGDNENLL